MPITCYVSKPDTPDLRSLGRSVHQALAAALDIVFPPCCMACDAWLPSRAPSCFCRSCGEQIQLARPPFCQCCGRPYPHEWQGDHLCGGCLLQPPSFSMARSWAYYPGHSAASHPLREVIHRFKYGRQAALGQPLGRLMARTCQPWVSSLRPRSHHPGSAVPAAAPLARLQSVRAAGPGSRNARGEFRWIPLS